MGNLLALKDVVDVLQRDRDVTLLTDKSVNVKQILIPVTSSSIELATATTANAPPTPAVSAPTATTATNTSC